MSRRPMSHPDRKAEVLVQDLVFEAAAARVLDRVDLRAGGGEFIGLVGPNGAGKTTLLRLIGRLLRKARGSIVIEGLDVERISARDAARAMGYVPQVSPESHGFTALEIVLMGRYPHLGRFQVEGPDDHRIAVESMRLTDTEPFADRSLTSLSGGERQRVLLARALAQKPRILLLDEPTANLDVRYQLKVLGVVRDLVGSGITAIGAVHDLEMAARFCDRLLLLAGGRVIAEGKPDEVLTPENVEDAFGVRAAIYRDALTGALAVTLLGPAGEPAARGQYPIVHVVCGGGTGGVLMQKLRLDGFTVTACPLGAGDSDRVAADALGVKCIGIPAFSQIGDDTHVRHVEIVVAADVAVLCETPFGANNLRNLEALRDARRLVTIESQGFGGRDFTDGEASRIYGALRPAARVPTVVEAVAFCRREAAMTEGPTFSPVASGNLPQAGAQVASGG